MTPVPVSCGNEFIPLGDLPGGFFSSEAVSVNSDGTLVVGSSSGSQASAFVWDEINGLTGIGSGFSMSVAADSSTVVGGTFNGASTITEPFRWTSGTGLQLLGNPGGGSPTGPSAAADVNSNGQIIVGWNFFDGKLEAFRWTESGGYVRLGDLFNGNGSSTAMATSADGTVVVGQSTNQGDAKVFRWSETNGMEDLSDLAGVSVDGGANNVSADGTTIVGFLNQAAGLEAFAWDETGGVQALGFLNGTDSFSQALATTESGEVVVGFSSIDGSSNTAEAFVWDDNRGLQSLQTLLEQDRGLAPELANWTLSAAFDISPDGRNIVGRGINPAGDVEGWLVRLDQSIAVPEPASLGYLFLLVTGLLSVRRKK